MPDRIRSLLRTEVRAPALLPVAHSTNAVSSLAFLFSKLSQSWHFREKSPLFFETAFVFAERGSFDFPIAFL
jgi:hypothetical protein